MAGRPPKQTLDWAPWDTDIFFRDDKICELTETSGWKGFGIYFYLCQLIYRVGGYFMEWAVPSSSCRIARQAGGGIRPEAVQEIVCCCLRIGVFDQVLYDRWGILTSRAIQTRFAAGVKERKHRCAISEYWLLTDEETEKICPGLMKVTLTADLSARNGDLSARNGDLSEYKKKEEDNTTTTINQGARVEPPDVTAVTALLTREWGLSQAEAAKEARRFCAYNAGRGWDCMPSWTYALEKWVAAMIEYDAKETIS